VAAIGCFGRSSGFDSIVSGKSLVRKSTIYSDEINVAEKASLHYA
jgi:hypothetical protein